MRLVIQGKELEFRVQERRIVTCSVFHKGEEIAADLAICAPQDPFSLREGEKLAVERAAAILFERHNQERQDAIVKVDKVFTEVGAISGDVELPSLETPDEIVGKVMEKLDERRAKENEKAQGLAAARVEEFRNRFPYGVLSYPGLAGLDFLLSPYLPGRALSPTHFGLPFGISTKPRGF